MAENSAQEIYFEKPHNVTTGKGIVLHRQAREIIYRIYCFISVIYSFLPKRFSGRVRDITELATGVSNKTIQANKNQFDKEGAETFSTPKKQLYKNPDPVQHLDKISC